MTKNFDENAFRAELEMLFTTGANANAILNDGDIADYREEWYWLSEYFHDGPKKAYIALQVFMEHGFVAGNLDCDLDLLSSMREEPEWWPVFYLYVSTVKKPNEPASLSWSRMIHGEEALSMIEQCRRLGRMKQARVLEEIAERSSEKLPKKKSPKKVSRRQKH